jgi:NADH-quinone oxidoreductase subunit N
LSLLVVSFWRSHQLTAVFTGVGFGVSFLAIIPASAALTAAVTPLVTIDRYALFFVGLFVLSALATTVFSYRYLEGRAGPQEEYYVLLSAATLGAITMACAAHFATLLLGLEILSIALYGLIAYPEEGTPPLEAALKYLVLSGVASTTMLFGMAMIYLAVGSLSFAGATSALADQGASLYLIAGNALLLGGIAFKLSLVPFHMWTPDVYEGAPAPVAGYLATVSKGAVFALALRYLFESGALANPGLFAALSLVAVLTMVLGNALALLQDNVKRILGYSSIAHLGYLLIGLLALNALTDARMAIETSLVYLVAYSIMTLGAFGVVTLLSSPQESRDTAALRHYTGLFWRRPIVATVFTIVLLSLAGLPLTAGFIAKFYLFAAGIESGLWLLLWTLILGSAIGLFYYLRIVFAMTKQAETGSVATSSISFEGLCTACFLALLLIAIGVYPGPLTQLVRAVIPSVLALP